MRRKTDMEDRKQLVEKILENVHIFRRGIASEINVIFKGVKITQQQWLVLYFIKKNRSISVKDLAKLLVITSSATTQIVDGLVNKGLLTRKRIPDDRRTLKIELSEDSMKQFDLVKNKSLKTISSIFNVLDDELLKFYELGNKVMSSILSKLNTREKENM